MHSPLLAYYTAFLALGISLVCSNQIPAFDGVVGGLPSPSREPVRIVNILEAANISTTPGKLRGVVENSGICETTPGVRQASGYADISANGSIWFWYFEARSNPSSAPLALWFNGGPGSSSMIGLFQEHGPCRITNDSSSVTLNPYSWNNNANILYIDQPVGVGFSHGNISVGTSQEAAADIWTFMQIFLSDSRFSNLSSHDLALWTESYGGHYGPTFAAHFLSQNQAISNKTISGIPLNLRVLGIGDGLTDPESQYPAYVTYAASNGYHPLVSSTVLDRANSSLLMSGGCLDQIKSCNNNGSNMVCSNAQIFCNSQILSPLAGNFDVYYVPTPNPDPYPPAFDKYLASIQSQIGAEVTWQESNEDVYINFAKAGDSMRTSVPDLETVIDAGVRTIIYDGDADFILNFNGVEAMVDKLNTQFSAMFKQQEFQTYMVAGQGAGMFKNAGLFSYVRIFGAGHEVPAYKFGSLAVGQAASQMFEQIMANQSLSSVTPGKSSSSRLSLPTFLLGFWILVPLLYIM